MLGSRCCKCSGTSKIEAAFSVDLLGFDSSFHGIIWRWYLILSFGGNVATVHSIEGFAMAHLQLLYSLALVVVFLQRVLM